MEHGYLEKVRFTPCGRRVFAFFMGNPRSKDGVLEIGPAVLLGDRCGWGESDYKDHCHYTTSRGDTPDVPGNVVWSNDGLFVATLSGGVMRMGLVP